MSFLRYKTHIEEGELVIAYLSRENMTPLIVDSKKTYNNKFGIFKHKDMIGFMYLLHPTPELWTHVVPHRTQILYAADISYITTYLDLKPGSVVLESGTGSGSFSHSLARTIAPNGHLYTFEFHEERAKAVKQDFEEHGLSDLITIECRDVCKNGFGVTDLVHAGKISCFSPCIEQVQRTCASLNENGFVEIKMYECLMREHEIKTIPIYTVTDAVNKIKLQQDKKRKRKEDQDEQDNANADSQVSKSKQDPPNLYVSKTPNEVKGHT
ncbi:1445_t:CDS:2, partial [Funneliformis mosseae]